MKKLFPLILALMMALTCVSAFADTMYTKVSIDEEVALGLLAGFGVSEDQLWMVNPIISLVNALGVNVITVADGMQIDLDLNGKEAVSLGYAMDEQSITAVSTLFPNYVVTMTQETLSQMMEQFMANMPGSGEGGAGTMDMAAMSKVFGDYYQRWFEACAAAGHPGDPVPGEYEIEGYTFDTMVPVTVDIPAIAEATKSLMDEMMADPAAMSMIKGMAQGMAQKSGEAFDDASFEADFKAGFEEWLSHFPDETTAEYYCNGEAEAPFYLIGESTMAQSGDTFTYDMLYVDEANMDMGFVTTGEGAMMAGFTLENGAMSMYFSMDEMYLGLDCATVDDQLLINVYFMSDEAPLVSIYFTKIAGGERTLAVDATGKTVLAVEDAMSDQSGEAVQGLMGDIMTNGLGSLMTALSTEVPDVAGLIGMFTGGAAMAG